MNLPFMLKWKDGSPTNFVEKIWAGLRAGPKLFPISNFMYEAFASHHPEIVNWIDFKPKIHTIRESAYMKVGHDAQPCYWSGKPYHSKPVYFTPRLPILSVQEFSMTKGIVKIDNRVLTNDEIIQLAYNDGFDDLDGFSRYFYNFEGYLRNWTKHRY